MIDLALADVIMPLQLLAIADFGANGHVPKRGGTYLNGGAAYYSVYRTADDRFLTLGAIETHFWAAFCRAAEHPEWMKRHAEPIPQADLADDLQRFFRSMPLAEVLQRFSSPDCCVTPVMDLGEAVCSPRIVARELVRQDAAGQLQSLFPVLIDGEAPALRTNAV